MVEFSISLSLLLSNCKPNFAQHLRIVRLSITKKQTPRKKPDVHRDQDIQQQLTVFLQYKNALSRAPPIVGRYEGFLPGVKLDRPDQGLFLAVASLEIIFSICKVS